MKDTVIDLKNRRSVKEFKPDQITDEELMQVIEAGMNAPSEEISNPPYLL